MTELNRGFTNAIIDAAKDGHGAHADGEASAGARHEEGGGSHLGITSDGKINQFTIKPAPGEPNPLQHSQGSR